MQRYVYHLVFGLLVWPSLTQAKVQFEVGLSSANYYRGLERTNSGPTLNGSAEYSHSSGLYVGAWASRVEFPRPTDKRNLETDLYAGYQKQISNDLSIDVGLRHYRFDKDNPVDYVWTDLQLSAAIRDRWVASLAVGDNWLAQDTTTYHGSLTYRHPMRDYLTVEATIGHHQIDSAWGFNYQHATLGLTKSWQQLDLRGSYWMSNNADFFRSRAKSGWQIEVSWVMHRN